MTVPGIWPGGEIDRHTVFPLWLLEEIIELLKRRNVNFKTFGECEVDGWFDRPQWRWPAEYARTRGFGSGPFAIGFALISRSIIRHRWNDLARLLPRKLINPKPGIEMFLQHDADRAPERTLAVMMLEDTHGVRSSNYFFRQSAYPDEDGYELDLAALKALERKGFEIGYHQNAYELSGYQESQAMQIANGDAEWFRENFNLRSFVPHGGSPGPNGLNNESLNWFGGSRPLLWAYNRYGVLTDFAWTDGGVESKAAPEDPRAFVLRLPENCRARMLLHPQYYGERVRPDVGSLPIARLEWWQRLWD